MSESHGRWNLISRQLENAAAKTDAVHELGITLDQDGDTWPCWVPTSECLTLDGHETPLGLSQ